MLWRASSCHGNTSPRSMSGTVLPALALARTARDMGLQRAMTLPDMWWAVGEQKYPLPVTAAASETLGWACSWCQCFQLRKGHDKCWALSISILEYSESKKSLMSHSKTHWFLHWIKYDPFPCTDINKRWSAMDATGKRLGLDDVFFSSPFVNSHHWLSYNFVTAPVCYQLKKIENVCDSKQTSNLKHPLLIA